MSRLLAGQRIIALKRLRVQGHDFPHGKRPPSIRALSYSPLPCHSNISHQDNLGQLLPPKYSLGGSAFRQRTYWNAFAPVTRGARVSCSSVLGSWSMILRKKFQQHDTLVEQHNPKSLIAIRKKVKLLGRRSIHHVTHHERAVV